MKLGKQPARVDKRTVLLRQVAPSLPEPLDHVDWLNGKLSWGMMRNDSLGDCTCAAIGHAEQTLTGNVYGLTEVTPPDADIVALYSAACGYVPGNAATDQGGNELDVLNYVRKNGVFGVDQLLAYADTNPGDTRHVKQAISMFGGVYIGLQLPDSVCKGDLLEASWNLSGKIQPNPYNGHAVWVPAYNSIGPMCITWGAVKQMSWAFWLACCDESHVLLFKSWLGQYGGLTGVQQALENALGGVAN